MLPYMPGRSLAATDMATRFRPATFGYLRHSTSATARQIILVSSAAFGMPDAPAPVAVPNQLDHSVSTRWPSHFTELRLINSIVDELASQDTDAVARDHLAWTGEARVAFKASGNAADRRRSLAPAIIAVFRTDADPRTVDLSQDPSERPYGSLFGTRPDLINYGLTGFGRLTAPEAWLSTWSGLSSNADFVRCAR
jgi:hypothetical protein